ncbi:MAG: phosphoribosylformylglycinamidine synthase subunit PurL [Micrococcales bacterium]|nr:phosphoribosylformylglycinamidine synthase subunit PurL [Micrococcales bacterium]
MSASAQNSIRSIDTVAHATATPNTPQPWADLGLKAEEYAQIREVLGRRPTSCELAMYSVMWSEHCSYKSSKLHLGAQFGKKTTPEMRKALLAGIGGNAGVVDIGGGWAVTFKVESHNHPSFVEPYGGAATGVGGVVRDIVAMGARPVAVMAPLRFGKIDDPDTKRMVHGVVAGLMDYSEGLGLPCLGGETVFDPSYQGNPLVNAACIGVLRHEDLHEAAAHGKGNLVVLLGGRTGGDGVGGASIMASETFEDELAERPEVPQGDPELERRLIEACLDLFEDHVAEGISDLGAAGLSCATSELASSGDGGMAIDLDQVLLRDEALTPEQILMSESQERMMVVVRPDRLDDLQDIAQAREIETAVLGEVTDTGRLTITWRGELVVDVDPRTVAHESPVYDRPYQRPDWQDALQADVPDALPRPHTPQEISETILTLAAAPNLCSRAWVSDQLDSTVGGNTAQAAPHDAGVLRVDEQTGLGIAIATDGSGRYTMLDPRTGGMLAVAEAYRNTACSGARPLAVTDGLNFGSPESPASMWQLVEAMTGIADACLALGIPVCGGNVSLYNETGAPGLITSAIQPTPIVGVLGVVDDVAHAVPSTWSRAGLDVALLGATAAELGGSAWADVVHDHLGGMPPAVDLPAERALAELLTEASDLLHSAHDLSEGGLAQALVECVAHRGIGAEVSLDALLARDGLGLFELLFSETQARAIVSTTTENAAALAALAAKHQVPFAHLGATMDDGGTALAIEGLPPITLPELREAFEAKLPQIFA